jgi:DNA-binding transcriptional LysR family regulator
LPGDGQTVALADLVETQWVHFTPPSGLGDVLNEACARAGFEPRAAVRTEQAPSALNLARVGLGITLVPGNIVPPEYNGVVARVQPPIQRSLSVYTRVRPDPITAAFVEAVSNEALTNPPHLQQLIRTSGR